LIGTILPLIATTPLPVRGVEPEALERHQVSRPNPFSNPDHDVRQPRRRAHQAMTCPIPSSHLEDITINAYVLIRAVTADQSAMQRAPTVL
jgi:hypothetical protein